jgi:hypothetical protein
MKPDLTVLPNNMISVCGFGENEASASELHSVLQIYAVSRDGSLLRMVRTDVPVVLINLGINRAASLTITGDPVYLRCLQC